MRVVAVVGEDFTRENEDVMKKRGVDTRGIQHAKGKTFHWTGEYGENVNEAKTLNTELNVFETFQPSIPAEYNDSDYLFLANIDPVLQKRVRDNMQKVKLVGGDTMNYWISGHRENLDKMLKRVDVLLINDGEAKMLADDNSLPRAARKVMELGPASAGHQARRVRRDHLLPRSTNSAPATIRFALLPCRSMRYAILPARATALPAASWATLRHRVRLIAVCCSTPCSTAA